jgi:hypothetical protein
MQEEFQEKSVRARFVGKSLSYGTWKITPIFRLLAGGALLSNRAPLDIAGGFR